MLESVLGSTVEVYAPTNIDSTANGNRRLRSSRLLLLDSIFILVSLFLSEANLRDGIVSSASL